MNVPGELPTNVAEEVRANRRSGAFEREFGQPLTIRSGQYDFRTAFLLRRLKDRLISKPHKTMDERFADSKSEYVADLIRRDAERKSAKR
jgi:hypothetical protein